MQISQQALYASTLSNQNYTFIRPPPPASLLHHFALICLPHISKSLFIGIYRGFYHFSYKKDGEYFPSFFQCCPFTAENWRNFRSLYFSFLTVTLACHYWGFLCPPSGSEAPRTKHWRDKGHQLHPLLLIHLFIPPSLLIPLFLFTPWLAWLGDILTLPVGFDLAGSRDSGDGGILLFFIYIQAFHFWFCMWDDMSTIYVIRLIQLFERVVFNRW